ncbi:MAG: hypothetical protein ACRC3A_04980, partial [Culicoidibacterales bacterium]
MPKRSPLKPRRYQPTLDGRRCNISFGQIPDYLNAEYRKHLDDLVIEKRKGTSRTESTTRWLANISDDLHAKVAAVGLCEGRGETLLGPLLSQYVTNYGGGKKPATITRWKIDVGRIVGF